MPTWPPGYWDDNHMRKPHIRKGRQCVFPEVPRTHTFGAVGASNGMFFQEHLDNMVINTKNMDWRLQVSRQGLRAGDGCAVPRLPWVCHGLELQSCRFHEPIMQQAFHTADAAGLQALL